MKPVSRWLVMLSFVVATPVSGWLMCDLPHVVGKLVWENKTPFAQDSSVWMSLLTGLIMLVVTFGIYMVSLLLAFRMGIIPWVGVLLLGLVWIMLFYWLVLR